jgi:hypothetical protein
MVSKQKDVKKMVKTNDQVQKKSTVQTDDIDDYQDMIAEAAYYKAESRKFAPDQEMEDWLEAEKEVRDKISKA